MVIMVKLIKNIRRQLLMLLTHKIALPVLKQVRTPAVNIQSLQELKQYPGGSLGNELADFLSKRNLPLLPHYVRHDLKHVLLGYDTTETGEVCLQSFMLGNGRISIPVLATVLFGILTMPEHWKDMRHAYTKGKKSHSFHHWEWNSMLMAEADALRRKIFNT